MSSFNRSNKRSKFGRNRKEEENQFRPYRPAAPPPEPRPQPAQTFVPRPTRPANPPAQTFVPRPEDNQAANEQPTRRQPPPPKANFTPEHATVKKESPPQRPNNSRARFNRPVFTIPIIPVDFNSFQVRQLCDRIWDKFRTEPNTAFRELRELLDFFELLRKAIIQVNVKSADKVKHLNPEFQTILSSFSISSNPDPTHSWFAAEKAPRPDNSREYDEEQWSKMFIQMLPRAHHTFPVNVSMFHLLGEISQQITQSEVATIRHELILRNSDSMRQDVRSLEKQADRENWSEEKFDEEMKKIEAHYNVIIYEARQQRLAEINQMYDNMYAYVNEANVNNFSDLKVLSLWRFITRNPCFPNSSVTFGNLTIPGNQLSLVELYDHEPAVFSTNYANLYSWYYNTFPNLDASKVSQGEHNAWIHVSTYLNISKELFDLSTKPFSIVDLTQFDNRIFSFYEAWQSSRPGLIGNFDPSAQPSKGTWRSEDNYYPYKNIGLLPRDFVPEIMRFLNRLTPLNFSGIFPILKAFNPDVVLAQILNIISNFQDRCTPIICKLAQALNISPELIFNHFMTTIKSKSGSFPAPALSSTLPILLIQKDFNSAFSQIAALLPHDYLQVEILHSLVQIDTIKVLFKDEILANKEFIASTASTFSNTSKSLVKYYAVDIIEFLSQY